MIDLIACFTVCLPGFFNPRRKIDLSFVCDVTTNSGNASIVRAVIALGHRPGLGVIAEDVEEEGQARYLHSLQCDVIQG